jgi:hypothetical protein
VVGVEGMTLDLVQNLEKPSAWDFGKDTKNQTNAYVVMNQCL